MRHQISRRALLLSSFVAFPCCGILPARVSRAAATRVMGRPSAALMGTGTAMEATSPLRVVLLGDIMLGRLVDDSFTCNPQRKTAAFGDVLPFLHSLDPTNTVIAGNLECAIAGRQHQPTPKAFNFRLSPSNADVLTQLRLGFAATANNHVLDFGQAGLAETAQVLDHLGIAQAGCGLQPAASHPAVIVTPKGHRVAFLAYSDHYQEWAATASLPGINYIDPTSYDTQRLQGEVAAARAAGPDLVVVMIHWGPNWRWQPDQSLRQLGRDFLAAGADLVFGTSPHHIQGVEIVDGKPIIYSGGSFIDDYAGDEEYRNDLSAVMVATFGPPAAAPAGTPAAPVPVAATAGTNDSPQPNPHCAGSDAGGAGHAYAAAGRCNDTYSFMDQGCSAGGAGMMADAAAGDAAVSGIAGPLSAPTAAGKGGGSESGVARPRLVMQELWAHPIAISHHWRHDGGLFAEAGGGNPRYFSQVDLAQGANRQWVVHKLQQLCDLLGGSTEVVQQPGSGGVRLVAQQQGQQQQQGQVQHKHDRTAGPARHVCDEA